jgi:DNA-binding beta-propeller fold protein YncE
MNTLGDIIAACINSAGGVAGDGSACGNMFSATGSGGTFPTDTITAALKIAQRPGVNVAALFALVTPAAPFQPTISQPNDFTIAVNYTGGSINAPTALASDASGNVWVANGGNNTVTELAHTGSVMSGGGFTFALNLPSSIAIDSTGTAWVTNKGNNTISRFSAAGAAIGAPLTAEV